MLSKVSEHKMRVVRGVLAVGWLILIASLFWDPVTVALTRPENVASPFHLKSATVPIQGHDVSQTPYSMSNRIFWTMLVPLLPIFFMIAGHEAWRRICPLSFFSQIPRYLGWQRKRPVLIRRTGQIERQLALVSRDGWLKRNAWYVQFGLLFLALNGRLLFLNSDRTLLAIFLLGVILAAVAVGYFWGGKTWCHYICPVGIVQKIYTEPRGIFESKPHINRQSITQSMCRTSTKQGERSTCVGCNAHCPDIDLERSYWETISDPALRNVYYGFFGLIVGFNLYFYLYAGNWDYYFSGIWTHEADIVAKMFKPGLFFFNTPIAIPKIIAVPLVLLLSVGLSILLGKGCESLYRKILQTSQSALSEPEIINRCLTVSAWLAFNAFYLFAGRSNINLMPPAMIRAVDIFIVAMSTIWLFLAIQRSPTRYRRESLASSLMEQLRKLKIDISRYVETPNIERLSPDEVYVLAKTLPTFTSEQRLHAYRNILADAIRTGRTDSVLSIERLRELRQEIGVTDEEHRQLLEEFGIDNAAAGDAQAAASYENWLRTDNYRRMLESLILVEMEQGMPLDQILAQPAIAASISEARENYQINADEHKTALAAITGHSGLVFDRVRRQIELLRDQAALRFSLDSRRRTDMQWEHFAGLLGGVSLRRSHLVVHRLFAVLRTLGDVAESRWIASSIASLLGNEVEKLLTSPTNTESSLTYEETLAPQIVRLLRGDAGFSEATQIDIPAFSFRDVALNTKSLQEHLISLVGDDDKIVAAVALSGLSWLDLGLAKELASQLQRDGKVSGWMLAEVCSQLLGVHPVDTARQLHQGYTITQMLDGASGDRESFTKEYLSIGRAQDNDVVVMHPAVCPYQLGLFRELGQVWVKRIDPFATSYINGVAWTGERARISNGDTLSFVAPGHNGPSLFIEWAEHSGNYQIEHFDTISKLLWLSSVPTFKSLDLATVAELAAAAEVRLYSARAWLCRVGEHSNDAFLIQTGSAEAVKEEAGEVSHLAHLQEGAIVGELGVITGRPRAASVRISSANARIVTINGERLRSLMRNDPHVSMNMLTIVANYIR